MTFLASGWKPPFSDQTDRILPVRREILLGILYCDLIGFHTYDYARHFLSSCTRVLGLPTMPNGVEFEGRVAHVGTFPIGIGISTFVDVRNFPFTLIHPMTTFFPTEFEGTSPETD
jgi:trehalose-6-phosphate synthase